MTDRPLGSDVSRLTRVRSMLFVPGTRADMIAKLARFGPDLAVVDLEDAVAVEAKLSARDTAVAAIAALAVPPTSTVLVRVNPTTTPWFADDVTAAAGSAAAGIVVPKLESHEQLAQVHDALARCSWSSAVIVAGVETVLGVADARAVLATGVSAAYFGAEDYIADIGGGRSPSGDEVLYARSQVALATRLAAIPGIDQAVVELGDEERFVLDARQGARIGYQGKICIHPSQVALAHDVFTPTAKEIAHAQAVVASATSGVAVVDGQMVDDVHVRMARSVLARASVAAPREQR